MEHKDIIITRNTRIFDLNKNADLEEKPKGKFTFDRYMEGKLKIRYAMKSSVVFCNMHYYESVCRNGISLNKTYLVEKFLFDENRSYNKICFGLTNDFGEKKFYPYAAFRFVNNEF